MNISKFKAVSYFISTVLLTFLVNSNTIAAKRIYECKDAKGNLMYTDHPNTDPNCINPVPKKVEPARTINLKNGTAVKSLTEPDAEQITGPVVPEDVSVDSTDANTDTSSTDGESTKYSAVRITSPTNNESVNSCGGQYSVSFTSEPALASGDQAKLLVDGVPNGQPTTGASIQTDTLERGQHNIKVQVVNNGQVVKSSEPVNFMFMRNCAR